MPLDRARVAAELPPGARTWLAVEPDARVWAQVARAVAARAVRALWRWAGEPAHNAALRGLLDRDPSPCVRAVAAALGPCDPGALDWRRAAVVRAACEHLGLGAGPGVRRDVGRRAHAHILHEFPVPRDAGVPFEVRRSSSPRNAAEGEVPWVKESSRSPTPAPTSAARRRSTPSGT